MSIAQQILLKKLISLCKIKGWDASKIDSRGMCKGIDLYQGLQSHILGKEKDFFETLEHFGAWDEQKETLSPEIEKAAAVLLKCVMLQWELHTSPIKFQARSQKLLELFLENNAIDISALKQKFFMGYVFSRQELKTTLEKILKPQQITLICSTSIGHDIEVSYHEKPQPHYKLYDSEYSKACKQQFLTLDELVLGVIKSTFAMVQPEEDEQKEEQLQMPPFKEFPLTIEVLSNQEKDTYPQAIDLIKEFIVKRNEINSPAEYDGATPLALAASWGDVNLVKFLLERGANKNILDHRKKLPFHHAIESGDLASVAILYLFQLSSDEELNPLCKAARVGYLDIVDFLFEKKCDKYFTNMELGFFPLIVAIQFGRIEIVKYFIEQRKIPVNQEILAGNNKFSPLYLAAARGQLEIVKYLLTQGAAINKTNAVNDTALCIAAKYGHLLVVKCLIENSADINPTKAGISKPLYLALHNKNFNVVDYLVAKGEKLNSVDANGKTLFEYFNEDFWVIKYLIKNDKTIDSKIIVAAYNNARNKELWGVLVYLKKHPIIKFIEIALEKIDALKTVYQTKAFSSSFLDNSDQNIQKEQKFRNYEKGLEKFAESFLQNPLQDIKELVKEISEFNGHITGKVNQLIAYLAQGQQVAIDKVKLQILGQSVSMTKP